MTSLLVISSRSWAFVSVCSCKTVEVMSTRDYPKVFSELMPFSPSHIRAFTKNFRCQLVSKNNFPGETKVE
jgi:hypothetical protein